MKKMISVTFLLLFTPVLLAGQPTAAEPVTLEEALKIAPSEDRKILVDVYAAWCPYCQRMHSDVYTDENVLEAISEYFVWVKINVESENKVNYHGNEMTEAEFARALDYENVPTTYFLNKEGAIVGAQPGYLEEVVFSNLLNFIGSDAYLNQSFDDYIQQR
jgi:thioredoxin-related protein